MKQPSAPRIRSASPDDATAIAKIKVPAWRAAYRGIVPDTILNELNVDNVRDNWLGVSRSELCSHGIVAEKDDGLIGYVLFGAARNPVAEFDGQIFEIYVMPDQFGSGLAARLLEVAMARLKEASRINIVLWVFEANVRARRFYKKRGATVIPGANHLTEIGGAHLREVAYGFHLANTLN